ncbi:MAG: ABC transporter ATP-binding protein [Clostridia bacterium]|nr:ABC transporter ATP-binding protein [Clostridia bacterium]
MITLKNISVSFDKKAVIKDLSFTFESGKKYAIMGESGSGKTTVLNVISDLIKPQSGEVLKNNDCKIAYVFQEPRLFDWMSVLENVSIAKTDAQSNKAIAEEILINLGLAESLNQFPPELSGGMKQRVSIARAMAYEPDVILLDEPFKALDAQTKKYVATYLFDFCKDKTVIMVTHDESDLEYVDEVLKIENTPVTSLTMVKCNR